MILCRSDGPYGHSSACDDFNFNYGLFLFNAKLTVEETALAFLELTARAGSSYKLSRNAYNATWASAASTYAPNVDPVIYDPEWRRSSYAFCNHTELGTCSILTFNSYGTSVADRSITAYMHLIEDGSCGRQFTIPDESFALLIANPPTPIVENYYECTLHPFTAMFNAIGIATGNISALVPIFMFVLLPVMYVWLTLTGNVQSRHEYDKTEREAALDMFALQMLRIRDGKIRGMKKNGFLTHVAEELVDAANHADGGYPDSDDSDDEDDDTRMSQMSQWSLRSRGRSHEEVMKERTSSVDDKKSRDSDDDPPPQPRQSSVGAGGEGCSEPSRPSMSTARKRRKSAGRDSVVDSESRHSVFDPSRSRFLRQGNYGVERKHSAKSNAAVEVQNPLRSSTIDSDVVSRGSEGLFASFFWRAPKTDRTNDFRNSDVRAPSEVYDL